MVQDHGGTTGCCSAGGHAATYAAACAALHFFGAGADDLPQRYRAEPAAAFLIHVVGGEMNSIQPKRGGR